MSATRFTLNLALTPLVLALTWSSVVANVTVSSYTDASHFHFQRVGLPDLDQRRVGLPNGGNCYCVPTSTMNLLMYMANHGFPQVAPGPGTWTGYDTYYDATGYVEDLGFLMSTCAGGEDQDQAGGACDPDGDGALKCGTGGSAAYDGLIDWLGPEADKFIITLNYASGDWAPRLHYLAQIATSPGAPLMRVAYGRYEIVAYTPQGDPIRKRKGGHAVSFAGAFADGNERYLYSRDPAQDESPDDPFGQSTFTTKQYDVDDFFVRVTGQSGGVITSWNGRWMSGLNEPHNDGKMRLLDGVVTIRPKSGFSFVDTNIVVIPLGGFGFGIEPPAPGTIPTAGQIEAVVPDADGVGFIVLLAAAAGELPTVQYVGPGGESSLIDEARDAVGIATGRRHDLYVLANTPLGGDVSRYRPASGGLGQYEFDKKLSLDHQLAGGAYDDGTDELILISRGHQLLRAPRNLGSEVDPIFAYDIPTTVPLGDRVSVAPDPTDGKVWLASPASDRLFGLGLSAAGGLLVEELVHPEIRTPTSVAFDDAGRLHVRSETGVKVFVRSAAGSWIWTPGGGADFDGVEIGSALHILRSRTNFDPGAHEGPDWEHLDPAELLNIGESIPDCPGDLNADGEINVSDLVELILKWGPCPGCPADLDGDGEVAVTDLVELLLAWGPCSS